MEKMFYTFSRKIILLITLNLSLSIVIYFGDVIIKTQPLRLLIEYSFSPKQTKHQCCNSSRVRDIQGGNETVSGASTDVSEVVNIVAKYYLDTENLHSTAKVVLIVLLSLSVVLSGCFVFMAYENICNKGQTGSEQMDSAVKEMKCDLDNRLSIIEKELSKSTKKSIRHEK